MLARFELFCCGLLYISAWIYLCVKAKHEDYHQLNYQDIYYNKAALGFLNIEQVSYEDAVACFKFWPSFIFFLVTCMLTNWLCLPYKMEVIDLCSIIIMVKDLGPEFTFLILITSLVMSMAGHICHGYPFIPVLLGMCLLAWGYNWMILLTSQEFVAKVFKEPIAFPGFFASIVRSMILGVETARMSAETNRPRKLIANAIGYTLISSIWMPASFVLFSDWRNARDQITKYNRTGPFTWIPHVDGPTGETRLRKLSLLTVSSRIARILFSLLLLKYLSGVLSLSVHVLASVVNVQKGSGSLLDCLLICFTAYAFVCQFHVYYVFFYGSCRLIGDLQQLALSPLFDSTNNQLKESREYPEMVATWKKASLLERICKTEVLINCYMPEGPACLLGQLTSSSVWRTFDVGLYIVIKNYIYLPWQSMMHTASTRLPGKQRKLMLELSAISGACFTYFFVFLFHGSSWKIAVWVCISFFLWTIERFSTKYSRSYNLPSKLGPVQFRRLKSLGAAVIQTSNIIGTIFFLTNQTSGSLLSRIILTDLRICGICIAFLYCNMRIAAEYEDNRKLQKIH